MCVLRHFTFRLWLLLAVAGFTFDINFKVDAFSLQAWNRNHVVDVPHRVKIRVSMSRGESSSSGKEAFGGGATIEPPLVRAVEIANIVAGKMMLPLLSSLIIGGMPSDWETFWSRPNGELTNGQRIALALEKLGPTYVKFGQALASRPDIIPQSLANALSRLQDSMQPFDTPTAKAIIKSELSGVMEDDELESFLASLTDSPVAAASVGQVYKGHLEGQGPVAVKVQRPGIRPLVESDAALLRTLATWAESIPAFSSASGKQPSRLIATELVDAVEEFMSRIFEELDYRNEAANVALFASLYCQRLGSTPMCVVPEIFTKLCTDNVLIMEWVEGTKITAIGTDEEGALAENAESLEVIRHGISCTLSQLLETGVLHADPHGGVFVTCNAICDVAHETKTFILSPSKPPGNLLKVNGKLGYLDFGLLSSVPTQVRDALVCATVELVFSRDIDAVASLFGELQLLPDEVLEDPIERAALVESMEITMNECLLYPVATQGDVGDTIVPTLKFDKLLDALARLVPRFRFQLPPYFINNARAMSTLEGIARSLDPKFNVLQVMYPFALSRLLTNPTKSPVVDRTLQRLIRSSSGRIDRTRISELLRDSALITGYPRHRVIRDVLNTKEGRRLALNVASEEFSYLLPFRRSSRQANVAKRRRKPPQFLQL